MGADRMLDDIQELHERWGFDSIRFHDANFGVMQKRSREFARGPPEPQPAHLAGTRSSRRTPSSTVQARRPLDMMAESGMYVAEIGAEAGTDEMMKRIGKPIKGDDNIDAAVEMDRRGVQGSITYIIGYPGESEESMIATIDQCRRLHNAAPLARPNVWPYRPIPGTVMWDEAIALGLRGAADDRRVGLDRRIPPRGDVARQHPAVGGRGAQDVSALRDALVRPRARKRGWWEKRARSVCARDELTGGFPSGLWEARAFDLYNRVEKKLFPRQEVSRSWVDPGHKTGTSGNAASKSREAMTETTAG